MAGNSLGQLSPDELLDVADECDPDDTFLYSELAALGTSLASTAAFADRLVDSAYNTDAAFEQLLAARFRAGLREHSETALTDSAVGLVAAAVVELAAALGGNSVFADSTRGGSDLLMGVVHAAGEGAPVTFLTADDDGGAGRLVRRRLRVHGVEGGQIRVDPSGEFAVHGPVVHVGQYPSPGEPGTDARQILSAVEHLVLQMDDQQRAVIIAPARVLCDVPLAPHAAGLRSGLLRTGRVRAIVRLPQGLLRSKPREAQALWVLGPSFAEVPIAERWTMVADLSTRALTEDVRQDLVSDIVASMGNRATVRAHSFRFARLVQTRLLLASRKSLAAAQSHGSAPSSKGAEAALRVEELVRKLRAGRPEQPGDVAVFPGEPHAKVQPVSVQELIAAGNLKYIKGNRLEDADLTPSGGTRVLGRPNCSTRTAGRGGTSAFWISPPVTLPAVSPSLATSSFARTPARRSGGRARWLRRRLPRPRATDRWRGPRRAAGRRRRRGHQQAPRRGQSLAPVAPALRPGRPTQKTGRIPRPAATRAAASPRAAQAARRTRYPDYGRRSGRKPHPDRPQH
ncbi:hypothetical protein AHiyo8_pI66150 (plasmid) [Arthrobacter sp. Hiyo8]|nr:hypothetical protein AHiyo8_pI66150 [Arthrobacter sp. Hiyo8]